MMLGAHVHMLCSAVNDSLDTGLLFSTTWKGEPVAEKILERPGRRARKARL